MAYKLNPFTGNFDATLDDADYVLVDGTRPFTGTVGGVTPVASSDLATKEYVDSAISYVAEYFLNNTASDIGGIYYKMLDTPTGEGESTFTSASLTTGDDQNIFNWATDSGVPGVNVLEAGVYDFHIHAEKTAGTKPVKLYANFYHRTTGGTETLVATSEESDFITTKGEVSLHATVTADTPIATTDRVVVKVFANVDATGSDATIALYAEGTTSSHAEIPISADVLNQVYVRQDGTKAFTGDQSMGSNKITNLAEATTAGDAIDIEFSKRYSFLNT